MLSAVHTNHFQYNRNLAHDIIECLVAALEAKDFYTSGHSFRVAAMSCDLAKKIGLHDIDLENVQIAAHLHDIGKIGIPEQILTKKGKLSSYEYSQMQKHPQIGYDILSKSQNLQKIARIVLGHHERWDGEGYPNKLKGKSTPVGARIIAICDAIDAMTSKRPYRQTLSFDACQQEIIKNIGTQFDPVLVEATTNLWSYWKQQHKLNFAQHCQTINNHKLSQTLNGGTYN